MLGKGVATADYSPQFRFRKRVFVSALHVFGTGVERFSEHARHAVEIMTEEIESRPGQPFSPQELVKPAILVQFWHWLTSRKVGLHDPTVKNLVEFGGLVARQATLFTLYQLFPFLVHLPTQFSREIMRAKKIRDTIFPPEYEAHLETYTPGIVRDLTDSFISAYEEEIAKESGKDVGSMEDIPGLMLDVIFTGGESTSSALTWFFLYMVVYPDVQKKIRRELDLVVGRDRLPRWKDAQNLPYLQATISEVQRDCGMIVVPGTNTIREMTIAGYRIPKGTHVSMNLVNIHHDKREWREPQKFKPERFLDEDGKFVGWNKVHGFLPFSIGRRDCPGQSLAKIMMFTFAAMLLHRFEFELPEGIEKPTTKVSSPSFIYLPDYYQIVAKPRGSELEI